MPSSYAAFISYAHRYREWVAVLQRNLESCLRAAGADTSGIFLDQTDLATGRSWVTQLEEGLAKSEHLVLVATPEALASPRAHDEWDAFIARRRDWAEGRCHVVTLVETPLPPFLERIQRLDFVDHDDEQYRRGLRELAAGLLGRGPRQPPELPDDLDVPPAPADVLPPAPRRRLIAWLAPQVERKLLRGTLAQGRRPRSRTSPDDPRPARARPRSALLGDPICRRSSFAFRPGCRRMEGMKEMRAMRIASVS